MKPFWIFGLSAALLAGMADAAGYAADSWTTYRNEKFGYELAYPAGMEYTAYVDGASGALKDTDGGHRLVDFEVWPPGECPRQPAVTTAREVGLERAKAVTQADGPESSSACGDPVTVRTYESRHGAKIYELELTCSRETYAGGHDGTDHAGAETGAAPTGGQPSRAAEGTKGPIYVVDISPPWRKRILMVEPVGVDPRRQQTTQKIDPAVLREILGKLKTFPIPRPSGVCIEDLRNRAFSIGSPTH